MKKFSRIIAFLLCAMLLVTGCAPAAPAEEAPAVEEAPVEEAVVEEAPAEAEVEEMSFRFAIPFAASDPAGMMLDKFKALVEEKSAGKITVEAFPGGTLGDERAGLESLRTNSIQMAASSLLADATFFAPEYNIFSTPYLVKDIPHMRRILESDIAAEIDSYIEENFGIATLGVMDRGSRQLTCNVLVEKPEDLSGLKLRLPENEVYIKVWSALGATPVAIALTEVYTSLQTGVVAGQENPLATITANKFSEVQDYCMLTNHIVDMYKIQCSAEWWNGLSDAQKAVISESIAEAIEYGNNLVAETEAQYRTEMEAAGVQFVELDTTPFKEQAMDTINDLGANYFKEGLMDRVLAID